MEQFTKVIHFTKVDEAKRLVSGIATCESVDKAGEVCDYESTVPYYKAWSEGFMAKTDGKSLGNVREMHGNVAAGKLVEVVFNDAAKAIEITAKVVDEGSWAKVREGVLTGFSQGGAYVKKWEKDGNVHYTADPAEVSLVDAPCLPDSTFQFVRADGAVEMRKFQTVTKTVAKTLNEKYAGIEQPEQWWLAKDGSKHANKEAAFKHNAKIAQANNPLSAALEKLTDAIAERESNLDKDATFTMKDGSVLTVVLADDDARASFMQKRDDIVKAEDIGKAITEAGFTFLAVVEKKDYSDDERGKMAESGEAMEDGSFPIKTKKDLENAVQAYGRAKDKDKAKTHIMARAKDLGLTNELPDDWTGKKKEKAVFIPEDQLTKLAALKKNESWDAKCALDALMIVECLMSGETWEAMMQGEAEGTQLADLKEVIMRLKSFIASEIMESDDDEDEIMLAASAEATGLIKGMGLGDNEAKVLEVFAVLGKAHSKAQAAHLAAMSDHLGTMKKSMDGMDTCMKGLGMEPGEQADPEDEAEKAARIAQDELLKTALTTIADLTDRVRRMEKQPEPAKGSLYQPTLRTPEPDNSGNTATGSRPFAARGVSPEEARSAN